jgi:hypothetical protein
VIIGGELADVVMNVEFGEVADIAPAFADTTSKSYVVPAVNPVSVTVCAVTSAVFSVELDPYPFVSP